MRPTLYLSTRPKTLSSKFSWTSSSLAKASKKSDYPNCIGWIVSCNHIPELDDSGLDMVPIIESTEHSIEQTL
jgi:hypothetical protein